jgi:hypothetical protein
VIETWGLSRHLDIYTARCIFILEVHLHRTQVYLEESHYQLLRSLARRQGKSLAAVIRGILDAHFRGSTATGAQDPFRRVIGIGRGDGSAVAEHYEDYLYGEES